MSSSQKEYNSLKYKRWFITVLGFLLLGYLVTFPEGQNSLRLRLFFVIVYILSKTRNENTEGRSIGNYFGLTIVSVVVCCMFGRFLLKGYSIETYAFLRLLLSTLSYSSELYNQKSF